jgi:hypothetical protein
MEGTPPPAGPPPGGVPPTQPLGTARPGVPGDGPSTYGAGAPTHGGAGGGPAADAAAFARRHIRTPETKEFFKTSEFLIWLLTAACVLIAGLASDDFGATTAWTLVTALSFAYIVSRGIAKSGTRRGDPDRS